jgi:hypothetical protein
MWNAAPAVPIPPITLRQDSFHSLNSIALLTIVAVHSTTSNASIVRESTRRIVSGYAALDCVGGAE